MATAQASTSSALVGTTCLELALEGERLCKAGDFKSGIRYFEEAIKVGTNDERTLSAIYSQLGNAYFYMEDYQKALEYHKQDVTLVHSIGDEIAEAKACGNLGNTFKMLGKFDEAAVYCRRYLEISRKLNDQIGEGRALYNLGNVYHTQGKRMIGSSEQEPGELSNDIKSSLTKAIEYYESNLRVVTILKDYASMGRAHGNLGNTHYLLGNFDKAVESHNKRLELARQTNDKSAERRAHLNLGNANVFLGNFPEAIENYSATLKLAQELQDKFTEAHSCYSLANTYTFLREYNKAITFHLKYLDMIKEFDDRLGEGRACWSLVNIYQMVNEPELALNYAKKHYDIAGLLGDKAGLTSAKLNIAELEDIIAQKQAAHQAISGGSGSQQHQASSVCNKASKPATTESLNVFRLTPDKRQEQEQRRFKKQVHSNLTTDIDGLTTKRRIRGDRLPARSSSSERLFDMIAHFQSGRIDDQRCEISKTNNTVNKSKITDDKENLSNARDGASLSARKSVDRGSQPSIANPINAVSAAASAIKATYRKASLAAYPTSTMPSIQSQRRPTVSAEHRDQLFDLIAGAQGSRMDEQRASLPSFNQPNGVLRNPVNAGLFRGQANQSDQSGRRLPDTIPENYQREKSQSIVVPNTNTQSTCSPKDNPSRASQTITKPKLRRHFQTVDSDPQVHDEKFLDSLMKYQSTRFNDQRSEFPNKSQSKPNQPEGDKGQADNFFNLIVRFQSDRFDDQRSAPPAPKVNDERI